ncbi:Hemicentin-1 [Mizuhopecten yessoensis]|uniref:Hemicentin-1 n=1 Tax=Mizuhopecten yessoensis TaxID=6573 RepID=A0A210PEH0_MIZYE|nr:Hemicentin-1 [Mizuhopecten yessoensis]
MAAAVLIPKPSTGKGRICVFVLTNGQEPTVTSKNGLIGPIGARAQPRAEIADDTVPANAWTRRPISPSTPGYVMGLKKTSTFVPLRNAQCGTTGENGIHAPPTIHVGMAQRKGQGRAYTMGYQAWIGTVKGTQSSMVLVRVSFVKCIKYLECLGAVRLVNGPEFGEGRVEMWNSKTRMFYPICEENWNMTSAEIVCRQNGFMGAFGVVKNASYEEVEDSSIFLTTTCQGDERFLQECPRQESDACPGSAGDSWFDEETLCELTLKGAWALWLEWSACSVTCEDGRRTRTRTCDHPPPNHGGEPCPGDEIQYKPCTEIMCPVDGYWLTWSDWSKCSVTCENGTQFRTRVCNEPLYNGIPCEGPKQENRDCYPRECPVDGEYEPWNEWTPCTSSCGYGTRFRNRTCNQPLHGGDVCPGVSSETEVCNAFSCPVDGSWKQWSMWADCTVTCGTGTSNRSRECDDPLHGGSDCPGPANQTRTCNDFPCPIDGIFNTWAEWSVCSVTCANGTRDRHRTCFGPFHEGANCTGSDYEQEVCVSLSCPVDGVWEGWSGWDTCNVTCGGGGQNRYRDCKGPFFNGAECEGPTMEQRDCNMHNCPIDGIWTMWSNWTMCSVTCGGGLQDRERTCEGPFYGGANCTGEEAQERECNTHNCPVDGLFNEWNEWGDCSETCGDGLRLRERTCDGPYNGGLNCSGEWTDVGDCNLRPCPVDGNFTEWMDWSECSRTCGGGNRTRERDCEGTMYGGKPCEGEYNQTEGCNPHECPIDGVWELWGTWGQCSVTCANGTQWRDRECVGPFYGGANCTGPTNDSQDCYPRPCPVAGVWETWGSWGMCNVTCGGGEQMRSRDCHGPFYGGDDCQGSNDDFQVCNTQECPIDCIWLDWSNWDDCSVTCGGGNHSRYRDEYGPFYGGPNCTGPDQETKDCNTHFCPVDGVFTSWTDWYHCNVTCGGGIQWRNRTCDGPYYGGADCPSDYEDSRECNMHECPIDGVFTDWSDWFSCNVTCGGGEQWRNRSCDGPYYDGADCEGDNEDNRECNTHECPIDGIFMSWMEWGQCNVTCGGGGQYRHRECDGPYYGGANCSESWVDYQDCNTHNCPVDGFFLEWTAWGSCDVTCDGGFQLRTRECNDPLYGGASCVGDYNQTQDCNTHNCPSDGVWKSWSTWDECSVTCGGGLQTRNRTCDGPYYGGAQCPGVDNEDQICSTNLCPIPGEWLEWSYWSMCSTTCDGGVRERSRLCNETSYGNLTAPCLNSNHSSEACHTYPCRPFARHCSDLAVLGLVDSTYVEIRLSDTEVGEEEKGYKVFCDMELENGVGVTVIDHSEMGVHYVSGYEGAGSYRIIPQYGEDMPFAEAALLVDASANCSQYVEWECKGAVIHNPYSSDSYTTYFVNRTSRSRGSHEPSSAANYFPGGEVGSNACACGMDHSCAGGPDALCNCDINDNVIRKDFGNITYKPDLPLRAFCAGDTGDERNEHGNATVGPLICFGIS